VAVPLIAALTVFALPGVADAKKAKPDKPRVASFNLYLGTDLPSIPGVFNNPAFGTQAIDRGINAIGFGLNDVNLNDFTVRAKGIAKQAKKKRLDLIGLQEAALWKVQIPTDLTPVNPAGVRAGLVAYDYIETLLDELNKKAKSKKECAEDRKDANSTPGSKDDKKAARCYRGYKLAVSRDALDTEFFGDFDNNCGTVKPGCGLGPAFDNVPAIPPPTGTNGPPSFGGDAETNPGSDDTGIFFIDPSAAPLGITAAHDWNGDVDANCDGAPDAGATAPPAEVDAGLNVTNNPPPPSPLSCSVPLGPAAAPSDCPDSNAAGGFLTPGNPVGPNTTDSTSSCFAHGIDGDVSLTMRDAILVSKGSRVKAKNPQSGGYSAQRINTLLGGVVQINNNRGWVSVDAKVRGKKFHLVNTHLEADDFGTVREDQASELAAGPAAQSKTVIVGDLNSDEASADPQSPPAMQRLLAAGFADIGPQGTTSGHAGSRAYASAGETGALLNDSSNLATDSRIDRILSNSSKIKRSKGCGLIDKFQNGMWLSDHVFACSALKVK
jgi:endonuclease/exonuclease/phosphatase family metal-dependent hydrolase